MLCRREGLRRGECGLELEGLSTRGAFWRHRRLGLRGSDVYELGEGGLYFIFTLEV